MLRTRVPKFILRLAPLLLLFVPVAEVDDVWLEAWLKRLARKALAPAGPFICSAVGRLFAC